jgi:hypothetical protein
VTSGFSRLRPTSYAPLALQWRSTSYYLSSQPPSESTFLSGWAAYFRSASNKEGWASQHKAIERESDSINSYRLATGLASTCSRVQPDERRAPTRTTSAGQAARLLCGRRSAPGWHSPLALHVQEHIFQAGAGRAWLTDRPFAPEGASSCCFPAASYGSAVACLSEPLSSLLHGWLPCPGPGREERQARGCSMPAPANR